MIYIWENEVPLFDSDKHQLAPSLTPYLMEGENNPCCIIFPGGGYAKKAWDHEGCVIAQWLNSIGISALVADYRIAPYGGDAILADGQQSIRYARTHAAELGIDPHRIGVCGFSAGGHLAGCCATLFTSKEDRPDYAILGYAVLTLEGERAHKGTAKAFMLGREEDDEYRRRHSPVYNVTPACPPMFLWSTAGDKTVNPQSNTFAMHEACKIAQIPSQIEFFDHGPHGLGIPQDDPIIASWADTCAAWLKEQKII